MIFSQKQTLLNVKVDDRTTPSCLPSHSDADIQLKSKPNLSNPPSGRCPPGGEYQELQQLETAA